MKHLKTAAAHLATNPAVIGGFNKVAYAGLTLAFVSQNAFAQASTKGTLVNIFAWMYGLVGVLGGITLLVHFINAKAGNFLGTQDPRKSIVNTLIYVGLALSVVAIIQAIKAWVGSSGGDIGSL